MTRLGGTTKRFYRETRGIKVSGGQRVKAGTVLTREGDRWKPGLNVIGRTLLTAACDGEVYFTKRAGKYKKTITLVNVRSVVTASKEKESDKISSPKS